MRNTTLAQKQFLLAKETAGKHVVSVAYDPTKVNGSAKEAAATGAGYTEYYRETTTRLVEVIYYKT